MAVPLVHLLYLLVHRLYPLVCRLYPLTYPIYAHAPTVADEISDLFAF